MEAVVIFIVSWGVSMFKFVVVAILALIVALAVWRAMGSDSWVVALIVGVMVAIPLSKIH